MTDIQNKNYIIALDQGTTSSRAIIFDRDANVVCTAQREFAQHYPQAGWVEHDPMEIFATQSAVMVEALAQAGLHHDQVAAIGITNQRETTVVWEKATGKPIYNAIVWQCRRTAAICEELKARGLEEYVRENTGLVLDAYFSGTKVKWILDNVEGAREKAMNGELLFGTIDTWLVWKMTNGEVHVTDPTNASRTMLYNIRDLKWDERMLDELGIPASMLPEVKPSSEVYGYTTRGGGSRIPIAGIAGDQQASLIGQSCVRRNMAKCTFGTGGMMNVCLGDSKPVSAERSRNGTFPIVAWSQVASDASHRVTWGAEAIMLSAGTNVEWLRDDMGLISSAEESDTVARSCESTDGVVYVPALLGLGTPRWDYGARGALFGLTRGSTRAHIVRSVLEGVAQRGADLLEAIEAEYPDVEVPEIRVDGGMSRNPTFIQALANATGRPSSVSPVAEATTVGAAYLAGLAVGTWSDVGEIESLWSPHSSVDPQSNYDRSSVRAQWERAVTRAAGWITELSSLDF